MRLRFTSLANLDVASIYSYIAKDNRTAATRVVATIRATAANLPQHPDIGYETDTEEVRVLNLSKFPYRIFYDRTSTPNEVTILRVVHSARRSPYNRDEH